MQQRSKPLFTEEQTRALFGLFITALFLYLMFKGNKGSSFAKLTTASQPLMLLALSQIAKHSNMFESKSEIETDEDED